MLQICDKKPLILYEMSFQCSNAMGYKHKMPRKTSKTSQQKNVSDHKLDEYIRVESLLSKAFECVDVLLTQMVQPVEAADAPHIKRFELFFGSKASPADTVVKIVELYLRVQQCKNIQQQENQGLSMSGLKVSNADAALLDAFIARVRNAPI